MRRLVIALIVATLVPAAALAQGRRGGGRARGGGGAAGAIVWNERSTIYLFDAELNLTTPQEQQLTTIFDAAAKAAAPLATAAEAGKTALFEAVKSGQSDDNLERLAGQQAAASTQLQALQARTFAKLWALLTPDQQKLVDDQTYAHIGDFFATTARHGG